MKDKIIIDTSVWIDYFQKANSDLSNHVYKLLSQTDIYVPKIIIAELIQGAHSEKEVALIKEFTEADHEVCEQRGMGH